MGNVASWIAVGLIAGLLARKATGSRRRGCLLTIAIGVLGGLLGGILFQAAGQRGFSGFDPWSVLVAFVGATLLLLLEPGGGRGRRR